MSDLLDTLKILTAQLAVYESCNKYGECTSTVVSLRDRVKDVTDAIILQGTGPNPEPQQPSSEAMNKPDH